MQNQILLYLGMLVLIIFLVMLAQKIKVSYPIVLVIGGLGVSFIPGLPVIDINPEIIFTVFLPPLLFDAAWNTSWKEFWKWRRVIGVFAFLIVLITSCVVAFVSSSFIPGFTLALGFLLGGIVSPPDALAATTIFKKIKIPKRLVSIAEGESLLNDASSLIVVRFALAAVITGQFALGKAAINFVEVVTMGIAVGLIIGVVFYAIHRWLPTTANIDIVLSVVEPYLMYIIAERFHFSGVLAVVSGGLFLRSHSIVTLNSHSRFQASSVWSTLAFALNGLAFILIGLELPVIIHQLGPVSIGSAIGYGLLITVVLIVTRILSTLFGSLFTVFISRYIKTADSNPGWRGPLALGWAGMRGVVSLAAALSIPEFISKGVPFPQRNLILFITFIVILMTLVVQGLTLPWVVKKLNMEETDYPVPFHEQEMRVRKKLSKAALQILDDGHSEAVQNNGFLKNLKRRFENDLNLLDVPEKNASLSEAFDGAYTSFSEVVGKVLNEQRQVLHKINQKAEVDEDIVRKYMRLLDLEEEKINLQIQTEMEE